MSAMASQITGTSIVYSTVCSGKDQRKHQSSASLVFVPVTGEFPAQRASNAEMFPSNDVIIIYQNMRNTLSTNTNLYCTVRQHPPELKRN